MKSIKSILGAGCLLCGTISQAEIKTVADQLEKSGWQLVAQVDTRPRAGEGGGQFGVGLLGSNGTIGTYRYLLFDIARTKETDRFANTFFSEIDVLDRNAPPAAGEDASPVAEGAKDVIEADGGKYKITIDTTETPDLTQWARTELAPVMKVWYPKIVAILPSEGFEAPKECTINFRKDMTGVAATGGTRIGCAADWFRRNLNGEAKGSVVHELAHVVQQYRSARRSNPGAVRPPGWLVEGIPDYIRWFLYEPESRGAEIKNAARVRYDGSYRVSANFLNWVVGKYDQDLIGAVNAALREGRYTEELWKERTGHTVQELGEQWKKAVEEKLAAGSPANEELKGNRPSDSKKQAESGDDKAGSIEPRK
ncbi:MAG: basic secretory protein-like protein [Verrucomicrobiales bacterium]